MFEANDILRCAREIRPHLTELLGEAAPAVDNELAALIERAGAGEKVENLILEVFSRHQATREWARRYLQGGQYPSDIMNDLRQYSLLPGGASPVPASGSKLRCPKGDFVWTMQFVGQVPPLCPIHQLPLDPEASTP